MTADEGDPSRKNSASEFEAKSIYIDYTNYRGERRWRRIVPHMRTLRFEETPHHKPAQWVFDGYDRGSNKIRTFALASVHAWQVAMPEGFDAPRQERRVPNHVCMPTTRDRDDREILPTCAYCGESVERCRGTKP